MHLIICRNPYLDNAVSLFQVDHPLLPSTRRKKYEISRVRRNKDGLIEYQMSHDEFYRSRTKELYDEWYKNFMGKMEKYK